METPLWNLKSTLPVYEPAEDSFLLLDALESDLQFINDRKPRIVLEVGSGSGIIITALSKVLNNSVHCLAIDINENACQVTQDTALINYSQVDVIQGDLTMCLKPASLVDLLVFNPPYVVTSEDEISGTIERAWAGGAKGRVVIDRLLNQLDTIMSLKALFYLVVIKENMPEDIVDIMRQRGYIGIQVAFRKVQGEQLSVLRFSRY